MSKTRKNVVTMSHTVTKKRRHLIVVMRDNEKKREIVK